MGETLHSLGRFMVLVIILTIPYAGIIGVVLIPGWLFSCLRAQRIAPWLDDVWKLMKDGFISLILASALLLPGLLLVSFARGLSRGFIISRNIFLIQKSFTGNLLGNLGLFALLAGILLIPGFFQVAAAQGQWKDIFSGTKLKQTIIRLSYGWTLLCAAGLLAGFLLGIWILEMVLPLLGQLESISAVLGTATLEALFAVLLIQTWHTPRSSLKTTKPF